MRKKGCETVYTSYEIMGSRVPLFIIRNKLFALDPYQVLRGEMGIPRGRREKTWKGKGFSWWNICLLGNDLSFEGFSLRFIKKPIGLKYDEVPVSRNFVG